MKSQNIHAIRTTFQPRRSMNPTRPNGPALRAAFLEVLDNQIRDNDPPETKATVERLSGLGIEPEEVRRLVACVIAAEIHRVMKTNTPFDRDLFVARLGMLPDMPWMDEEV